MDDTLGEAAARAAAEDWVAPLGERRPTFASMAFATTRLFLATGIEVLGLWFLFELVVLGGSLVLLSLPSPTMMLTDPSGDWLSAVLDVVGRPGFLLRLPLLIVAYFVLRTPVAGAVAAHGAARQRSADVPFGRSVRAAWARFPRILGGSLVLGGFVAAITAAFVGGIVALVASADAGSSGVLTAGFLIPSALLVSVVFFYASSGLSLWAPVAMMEDAGPGTAVSRGWFLSRSYRWSLGAAYLVLGSLALAVTWILLAFVAYLGTLGVVLANPGVFQVLEAVVVALPLLGAALLESFFTLGSASAYNLILASSQTRSSEGGIPVEPPSGYGLAMGTIGRRP